MIAKIFRIIEICIIEIMDYRFAYLAGDGLLAIVWMILFFLRRDLRKQQLFTSFLLMPFAPFADYMWFYRDYWRPEYIFPMHIGHVTLGLESPLFAFLVGGIAAVCYEAVFRKHHVFGRPRLELIIPLIVVAITLMTIFTVFFGMYSIWASILVILSLSLAMMCIDKDIRQDAFWSCILMTVLVFFVYVIWLVFYPNVIDKFWIPRILTGITIMNIPLEEILWFAAVGIGGGILYEFLFNANRYPKKR